MGFQWDNKFYKECCLPFGLRTAPFLFNLLAEALHWIVQSWLGWEKTCHLLDDIIHIVPQSQYQQLESKVRNFVQLTNFLGIPRNDSKFELGQVITVFGYELDTTSFTIRLPLKKDEKVQAAVNTTLTKKKLTLWEVQVVAGLLSWSAPAVQLGWVFCRRLWDFERQFSIHRPQQHIKIPLEVVDDLHWWAKLLPQSNGIRFFDDVARVTYYLYTDASGIGMGGFYYTGGSGEWKDNIHHTSAANSYSTSYYTEHVLDINVFEVEAVGIALQKWGYRWKHQRLIAFTDNTATFRGILKGTLNSSANSNLHALLCLAAQLDIIIEPRHVAGSNNELADALSRFDKKTIANWCPHW